jgi:ABC-type transport system substrate-binding protein
MPTYAYDVEGATAQLKERVRGRRSTAGTAPTSLVQFTCLVPDNFAIYERIALIVQKQLYEAGVDMRLEGVPVKEFNARRDNGTFDALIIPPLAGPRVIRLYPFWHSAPHSTPYNPWGYGDPDVDAALEAMQDARDEAAFREATRRFGLAMYQNPPGIFLAWPEVAQAVSKRFQVNGENNRDAFYSIARWKPTALDGDAR